ncbi:MAG: AmmeMemoRadiSam system protein B [Candidatus Moraniibacteriota bacterium]
MNYEVPNIRRSVVAGMFYPADRDELSDKIDEFLRNVRIKGENSIRIPKVILVPHAGYEYSGQVAAYGYKLLEDRDVKTVLLLGSSHNYPVSGIITDGSDSWETPLGKVELDQDLISKLRLPIDPEPFISEHSLEVQLPFLQKVLPAGFKIVPILVGDIDHIGTEHALFLYFASNIAKYINENTLVIISSDMSHYPSYDDAKKSDQKVINSILTGDINKFEATIAGLEKDNIPNAATFMCAHPAVELGMTIAKQIKANNIQLLKYANSGDATGDKSRVVGYASIGFFFSISNDNRVETGHAPFLLEKEERDELLKIARDSVESFVKNGKIPNFISRVETQNFASLHKKSGIFVTLEIADNLRGCIGLMESNLPLYETISEMAVAAATQDPRFVPVSAEDLPRIKYEISVLSPMEKVNNVDEIELGKHGVKVQNSGRSGVFLPQVALETGWELEEFMAHLCRDKAGLPADCWQDSSTEVYIFTAEVFSD